MPAMEHTDHRTEADTRIGIEHLQQSVQGWMDGDRVLAADGSSLLALLERALAGLTAKNPSAARAGIEAFIRRVEALIEAGLLEARDGPARIEAAAAMTALLCSTIGADAG